MIGKSQLSNTNKLIKYYKGATGLKTGSTGLALYNLSASATRNGLSLIAVIMKAPTTKLRFSEAQKLLDYGFNNYSYKELAKKDSIIKKVNITKGTENELNATYKEDFGTLLKKGDDKNISQNISLSENLSAPILKNQKIGEITFSLLSLFNNGVIYSLYLSIVKLYLNGCPLTALGIPIILFIFFCNSFKSSHSSLC